MLRRSNSSSHIPVPKNLFNAGKSRSRSSTRGSTSSTAACNIPRLRRSSSENKPNVNRLSRQTTPSTLSKITPLNLGGRKFSQSKITPSSAPRSASSSKTCPGSAQERRTIQKLSTDKRWVADQYAKVQDFIRSSGLFDTDIVAERDIRPPSIKTFIYIASVLLKEIFPNITISNDNYKEVITAKLKVLHYPGTLANSVLKTVNTMHVWPQVIGFFGWLIDKVNLLRYTEDHSLNLVESEDKQNYLVTQKTKELLHMRYLIYNGQTAEEEIERVNQQFSDDLIEILEVNPGEYNRLEKEVQKKIDYLSKQDNEIENLSSQIDAEKKKIKTMVDDMCKFEEADVIQETSLNGELNLVKGQLSKRRARRAAVQTNVEKLEELRETQVCTYQEKLALEKKIDILSNQMKMMKEKIEHAANIKTHMEQNLTEEQCKLENAVIQWNRFLREWVIKKPKLKSLVFRETRLHSPTFLIEINDVIKRKTEIENEFSEELQKVKVELKTERTRRNKKEIEIEHLNQHLDDLKQEILLLETQVLEAENTIQNVNSDLDLINKACSEEIKKLQSNDLEELIQQAKELEELENVREEEVQKFSVKTVSFFVELKNQIIITLGKAQDIVDKCKDQLETENIEREKELRNYLENIKYILQNNDPKT